MLIAFAAGPLIDLLGPCHPIVAPVPVANPMTSCTYGDPGCGAAADAEAPRLLDLSDPLGKLRAGVRFAQEQVQELGLWMLLSGSAKSIITRISSKRTRITMSRVSIDDSGHVVGDAGHPFLWTARGGRRMRVTRKG